MVQRSPIGIDHYPRRQSTAALLSVGADRRGPSIRRQFHPEDAAESQKAQERIWGTKAVYDTEEEFAALLRKNKVRAVMEAITMWMNIDEIREVHDYSFEVQRKYSDVIYGHWLTFDPRIGIEGVREYRRAVDAKAGFIGFGIIGQQPCRIPPSDPMWDPFYELSMEADIPVLIHTGLTGIGQGFPGSDGIVLDDAHPRHIDIVAAKFPRLKILAARPAYPWQDEMIAVLLHKSNVSYELHGWSPKSYSPALRREIGGRLQDRIMFGSDYPVLKYEMLVDRWKSLGFSDEVLQKVFYKNAEAYFPNAVLPD